VTAQSILVTMKVRKQRSQGQFGTEKQSKNSSARGSIHEENMRIARDAGQDTRNWKNGQKFNRDHRSVNELLTSAMCQQFVKKTSTAAPIKTITRPEKCVTGMGYQPL
jgi:hypothetical protein